jgi:hypothetical protein
MVVIVNRCISMRELVCGGHVPRHSRNGADMPTRKPPKKAERMPRLVPELVPSSLWGRSAYRMLGTRAPWTKKIRPDALAKAKSRCEICGAKEGRLICHDKWVYDDKKAIATLSGFEIHCGNCDLVTHLGRMIQVSDNPESVALAAVIHLNQVNGCKTLQSTGLIREAYAVWEVRNKKTWMIRVAAELVNSYPELAGLPQFVPEVMRRIEVGDPSEVTNVPWIWARFKGKTQPQTERIGKWLFFVAERYVDNTWQNVKKNIEEGRLWKMAKVSTAWRGKGGNHVVCVYTYDHDDEADVMTIREHLRTMGFKRATSYKTDAQTLAGVYSDNTEGVAKYKA